MKQVITSVGTSVFTNFFDDGNDKKFGNLYRAIQNKSYGEISAPSHDRRSKELKEKVLSWCIENKGIESSAEIQSTISLVKNIEDDVTIHLIATDTIDSYLAGEIIKSYFEKNKTHEDHNVDVVFNRNQYVIKGLQVDNRKVLSKEGLPNLISQIMVIVEQFGSSNILFNITGGYKGVIPFLTIMATVNNCELYYINEKSSELMKISTLPLTIDYEMIEKHYDYLIKLENIIKDYGKEKKDFYEIYEELEQKGMIEVEGNSAMLSTAGIIFFEKYKEPRFTFYCDDNIWKKIEHHDNELTMRDLKTNFWKDDIRKKHTITTKSSSHIKYGTKKKKLRILYFEYKGKIYIYGVFDEDHDGSDEEIKHKFKDSHKQEIIKNSKPRTIEKIIN